MKHKVVLVLGQGLVKNYYNVFTGTYNECEEYLASLPSENDPGGERLAQGTVPYQEGCFIEDKEDGTA